MSAAGRGTVADGSSTREAQTSPTPSFAFAFLLPLSFRFTESALSQPVIDQSASAIDPVKHLTTPSQPPQPIMLVSTPPHLSFNASTVARAQVIRPNPLRERVSNALRLKLNLKLDFVDVSIAPKGNLEPRAGNLPRRRKPGQSTNRKVNLTLFLSPKILPDAEGGFFGRS